MAKTPGSNSTAKAAKPRAAKPKSPPAARAHAPAPAPATIVVHAAGPPAQAIDVKAGETWRFEAAGRWSDWKVIPCGPNGYQNFLADIWDVRPELADDNWLCVAGRLQGHVDTAFRIGQGVQHTFTRDGTLELFANDRPGLERPRNGQVTVKATRMAADLEAVDPMRDPGRFKGLMGKWRLLQLVAEQSSSVGVVAFLVLAVCAAIAFLTQGRDLVTALAEDSFARGEAAWRPWLFCLVLLLFAVQAWFWPRVIINNNCGRDRSRWGPGRPVLEWAPRLLGLAPFLAVAYPIVTTKDLNAWLLGVLVAITAAVFMLLIIKRDPIGRAIRSRAPRAPAAAAIGRRWVIATTAAGFLTLVLFSLSPVAAARFFGAPTVVFLGVGLLIPWIVIPVQIGRVFRIPFVLTLLVIALVWSAIPAFDNHAVGRRVGGAAARSVARPPMPRIALQDAYDLWRVQAPVVNGRKVMVLVAAEGGASRAGYWTGEVLSVLHDKSRGRLANALFAISSVSGGSVGAVGYDAVLQDDPAIRPPAVRAAVERLTGADALSPDLGGLLFPDLLARFLPLPILRDRAEGLERSWEDTWATQARGGLPSLKADFLELQPRAGQPWRPVLIINGASEETGRPILTSTVRLPPGYDYYDFHDLTQRDVAISTAIHNGARFPYVSPPGTLTARGGKAAQGHIIDGGYFDPVGTEAVRELAIAIARGPARARGDDLRFIFVVIKFEGPAPAELAGKPGYAAEKAITAPNPPQGVVPVWWGNEILGPLRGFFGSRAGHGVHMAGDLYRLFDHGDLHGAPSQPPPTPRIDGYAEIGLCEKNGYHYPMNWALSARAQTQMQCAATGKAADGSACEAKCEHAIGMIDALAEELKASGGPGAIVPGKPPAASD
jgi:hypothetical protein